MTIRSRSPFSSLLLLLGCAAALASALAAEHLFGLKPCVLCLTQRVPFALAGLAAMVALLLPPRWTRPLVWAACAALLVNAGVAVYHTGVEQHWWASSCAGALPGRVIVGQSLVEAMSRPAEVPCDQPAWTLFGLSMANFNIAYSAGLALAAWALARR